MMNKHIEYIVIATDSVKVNARGYSSEETLREYMRIFDGGFASLKINKTIDDIIDEANSSQGYSYFETTEGYKFKYKLVRFDYFASWTDYGIQEFKLIQK